MLETNSCSLCSLEHLQTAINKFVDLANSLLQIECKTEVGIATNSWCSRIWHSGIPSLSKVESSSFSRAKTRTGFKSCSLKVRILWSIGNLFSLHMSASSWTSNVLSVLTSPSFIFLSYLGSVIILRSFSISSFKRSED